MYQCALARSLYDLAHLCGSLLLLPVPEAELGQMNNQV
jgi:hypothetical protein